MAKILGLDLGSTSIGWAFIEETDNKSIIKKLGVRIIPYTGDEQDQFSKGQAISVNKDRTLKRTARKTLHRYKLRRKYLTNFLVQNGMMPGDELMRKTNPVRLYELRARGAVSQLSLEEIGRLFLLLNQKRGYKSSRHSNNADENGKKLSDYLTEIQEHKELLENNHQTIGQYFHDQLTKFPGFRIKKMVFPRECYINEFNAIWEEQKKYYPNIFTSENLKKVRDEIIYYQRRLKSQKRLVSKCRFELHHRVAPKSSPLFQIEKIWESIHTISLTDKYNNLYPITLEQKLRIFKHLDNHDKLSATELFKILDLKRTDGWTPNEQIKKSGLQGNTTKTILRKAFSKAKIENPELLRFNLEIEENANKETGEVLNYKMVTPSFEREPLYCLWHLLYSIDEPDILVHLLQKKYGFTQEQALILSETDFKAQGFGSKSARAIRKLLPSLMEGLNYGDASSKVGYSHSDSITTAENLERPILNRLENYKKNTLRQPVVEKILNQLINIVNEILIQEDLGRPDEIRVEMARELRQSQEERSRTYRNNIDTDKRHTAIRERLQAEFPGLIVSRKVIEKFKLFEQQDGVCIYSGKNMELSKVLRGEGIDVDHIIPQSRLFDDSFQNKVLSYRVENEKKDNSTALDYMKSKSEEDFQQYIERINRLFDSDNISRAKQQRLLMKGEDIPDDFINRQLNETRYVTREASSLLRQICRNVYSTSGSVTDFLRNQWGYNEVLKQLNWSKYEDAGKVKDGKIEGWSKRDDHRHHAIDALITACTQQGIIQRLNRLNSSQTREQMLQALKGQSEEGWQKKRSLLEEYVQKQRPFSTDEVKKAVAEILVSQKSGKKVSGTSKNKANGQKTLAPRGQLHKEQVYGKIRKYAAAKTPLNVKFKSPELIANPVERMRVIERLSQFENDPKKAFKNLEKDPIWLDEVKTKAITEVTLWEEHFVYKYTLDQNFKEKDIESIVDVKIKEKVKARFLERAGQKEHPLKNIENDPIWLNDQKTIPIKSVRCYTGYKELIPLHVAENGVTGPVKSAGANSIPIDFVIPRNNHHIAIYKKSDGKFVDLGVTLWEAVERKNRGISPIITDPKKTWDFVFEKGIEKQDLLSNFPDPDWEFIESLQLNEFFVFGFSVEDLANMINQKQFSKISEKLYRVQKISKKANGSTDMYFRHHLETSVDDKAFGGEMLAKQVGKVLVIQSLSAFFSKTPIKVRLDKLGVPSLETS